MRSKPAECSCCWELRTGTAISERFAVSHEPTTPWMWVSMNSWYLCLSGILVPVSQWEQLSTLHQTGARAGRQQEAGVGSRGRRGCPCLTGHLEMSDGDSANTLSSCAPGSQKGWDESKAEQPRQTWQNAVVGIVIHAPQRVLAEQTRGSCPTKPMQMPDRDQQLHSEVQSAVWKSQRYRLDPAWHRGGCSTEWQTVGVSTVCYSLSKMLPKTEERKKCLKSNVLV